MFDQLQLVDLQRSATIHKIAAKFASASPKAKEATVSDKSRNFSNKSVEETLNTIFPSQREESKIQRARRIMGEEVAKLSDQELEAYITEFEFLIDSWLDEFEKCCFDNRTLRQLIKEE